MSLIYTRVRLWWNGERGVAQYQGVARELVEKPNALAQMHELDYSPEMDTFLIRRSEYDRQDELTPPEIEALLGWLRRFSYSVKHGIWG